MNRLQHWIGTRRIGTRRIGTRRIGHGPGRARGSAALGAALALLSLAGCVSSPSSGWSASQQSWLRLAPYVTHSARPQHGLDDETVAAGLQRQQELDALRNRLLREELARAPQRDLAEGATRLADAYRLNAGEVADELLAAEARLLTWSEAESSVEIDARFASDGTISLTLTRREGVEGPLAVAIPPGTYGQPASPEQLEALARRDEAHARRGEDGPQEPRWWDPEDEAEFGHFPRVQDLAFLRAPVLYLPAGESEVVGSVPVACASFHKNAPEPGQACVLRSFPRGSATERLLRVLCSGVLPAAAPAQLAIWLSRDDISWEAFQAEGGHWGRLGTFGDRGSVLPEHAPAAAALVLDAGLDPRPLRFFEAEPAEAGA